jgi:hypothetical protein
VDLVEMLHRVVCLSYEPDIARNFRVKGYVMNSCRISAPRPIGFSLKFKI